MASNPISASTGQTDIAGLLKLIQEDDSTPNFDWASSRFPRLHPTVHICKDTLILQRIADSHKEPLTIARIANSRPATGFRISSHWLTGAREAGRVGGSRLLKKAAAHDWNPIYHRRQGPQTAAVIDLRKHKALREDIPDVLISQSRRHEKSVPLAKVNPPSSSAEICVASYRVEIKPSAGKELARLPDKVIVRIVRRLELLAGNPRPPGCKKLKGGDDEWHDDNELLVGVTRIRHRSEVYEQ